MIQVRSISCLQWFASAATRLDTSSDVAVSLNKSAVHGKTFCLGARSSLGFAEAGIRGCCSITAIRRTEFSVAVVQPKKSATPVSCRQRSYKGFPLLSNRIPSWLNRAAIDHEVCFLPTSDSPRDICRCLLGARHVDGDATNGHECKSCSCGP